jgi:hypothetical protein
LPNDVVFTRHNTLPDTALLYDAEIGVSFLKNRIKVYRGIWFHRLAKRIKDTQEMERNGMHAWESCRHAVGIAPLRP